MPRMGAVFMGSSVRGKAADYSAVNSLYIRHELSPPPPRSGGGAEFPLKKANAFFKGTRGGDVKNRVATALFKTR